MKMGAGNEKKNKDKGKMRGVRGYYVVNGSHIRYYLQNNIRLNKKTSHCLQKHTIVCFCRQWEMLVRDQGKRG